MQQLREELAKLEPGEPISITKFKEKFPAFHPGELRRLIIDQKDLAGVLGAELCRLGEVRRVATTDNFRKYLEELPPGARLNYFDIRRTYGYDLERFERTMIENHDLIEWLGRGQFARRGGGAKLTETVVKRERLEYTSEFEKPGEGKVQKLCALCKGSGKMILNRSSTGFCDCKYCHGNGWYWGLPDEIKPTKEIVDLDSGLAGKAEN